MSVDLNADVGEGMADAHLLPFLTSANVACGLHAGDANSMDETVSLAITYGVAIGAHPGYADRENFGRVFVEMPAGEVERLVLYQIGALDAFVRSRGAVLTHVKPHGALYHAGIEYPDVARAIAEAVRRYRSTLILVGKSGSMLTGAGRDAGLTVADEAFADRRYQADGSLVPRSRSGAVLTDPKKPRRRRFRRPRWAAVAEDGSRVAVRADTICVHGDTAGAPAIARLIRERLRQESIPVAPLRVPRKGGPAPARVEGRA